MRFPGYRILQGFKGDLFIAGKKSRTEVGSDVDRKRNKLDGVSNQNREAGSGLKAFFLLKRPRPNIVKHGFLEERVIEDVNHISVAASSRDAERRPDVLPGNEFHRSRAFGKHGRRAKVSWVIVGDRRGLPGAVDSGLAATEIAVSSHIPSLLRKML